MSTPSQHGLEPHYEEAFCKEAVTSWCADAKLHVIEFLGGGYSSAAVLLVEIEREQPNSKLKEGDLQGGFYVLKLDMYRPREGGKSDEADRHNDAVTWATKFASEHISPLIRKYRNGERLALLYLIAGKSMVHLARADLFSVGQLEVRARHLSEELLRSFNSGSTINREYTLGRLLDEWLGVRLDPLRATRLHSLATAMTGDRRAFVRGCRILGNPLKLAGSALKSLRLSAVFVGMLHGDLHRENVFWDRSPENKHFWLIDFAFARSGPLFFDHAYFELSLLLQKFEAVDPARFLNLLDSLLQPSSQLAAHFVSAEDYGILAVTRSFRDGIEAWQKSEQDLRADSVREQWCLARVAVGLNWANKRLDDGLRHLAFIYAAHAARDYLETFHSEEWRHWSADAEAVLSPTQTNGSSEAWELLWNKMGGFAANDGYLVLISGGLNASLELASLGFIPWAAVVDFDPDSDVAGLLHRVKANLEQQRALQVFGKTPVIGNLERSTAWLLAAGSSTLSEPSPTSFAQWRGQYKGAIRRLAEELRSASAPSPVRILVLPGDEGNFDKITRVLEELVDELGTNSQVIVAGTGDDQWSSDVSSVIKISVEEIIRRMAAIFGISASEKKAAVPGKDGPIEVDVEKIRSFEEDFEILHSNILEASAYEEKGDAFWRGSPPTWRDIEAEEPIHRDIEKTLIPELRKRLKDNSTTKIELFHTPGAGGTTVSLMVAWMLRRQVPTAVLRRNSRHTADRVSWLFHLAGLPVLLIADSAVVSRTEVDELMRRLANDNARTVLLHVIRVPQKIEGDFMIFDPMDFAEAERFRKAFAPRTDDRHKQLFLGRVSRENAQDIEPLRSPFFFGLITFEDGFTHLREYVSVHLADILFPGRKLLSHLSVLARFSQATLSAGLVRKLLNLDPAGDRPLAEAIGKEPARLIIEWTGRVKLIHPLVAEEILRQLAGEHWKDSLADICIDLIRDVMNSMGGMTNDVYDLFFHLFIEREDWTYDEAGPKRETFSPLLQAVSNEAGQRRILGLLTELCPDEPHYWNHLGRHYAYSDTPNYARAEECLLKAVEISGGRDALHHHALGLVRRFWIQKKVRDLRQKADAEVSSLQPEVVLSEVSSLAEGAFAAFEQSRKIRPDINYGYITHAQTILYIVEALNSTGGGDLALLMRKPGEVGNWVRRQITVAEDLMARLERLRGPEEESPYEITCLTKLAKLYGKFDVIQTWESMLGRSREPQHLRRAIATLYLARRDRHWSSLLKPELRKIVDLSEANLRADPTDDRDIRLWFQAIRRLPEFNYYEAIDRLEAWASRTESLEAHYYLYILYFLRWRGEGEEAERKTQSHIEASAKRRIGVRGYSFEWLASDPKWCPLIDASEIGEWDRQLNFFRHTHRLAYSTGTIESIRPQAGMIRLGQVLRAFFVPPADIREAHHLNATVHFYLGFSYEGFRAWGVRLGVPPVRHEGVAEPQKVWIGGIPYHFEEQDIIALFQPYGRVEKVDLPRDPISGNGRGYALVVISSGEDARVAIQALNRRKMPGGRVLQVREDAPESLRDRRR